MFTGWLHFEHRVKAKHNQGIELIILSYQTTGVDSNRQELIHCCKDVEMMLLDFSDWTYKKNGRF